MREINCVEPKRNSFFSGDVGDRPIFEFRFTMPWDYLPNEQLEVCLLKNRKKFVSYSNLLTDYNCRYTTNVLRPGKTYIFKAYQILKKIYGSRCLSFLIYKNSLFIGPQGLSLIWSLKKDLFPCGLSIVAFDKKMSLVRKGNSYYVPLIHKESSNGHDFYDFVMEEFDGTFNGDCCLFTIQELSV